MSIRVNESANRVVIEDPQSEVFVRDIWTVVQEYLSGPGGLHVANFLKIEGDGFISDDGQVITRVGLALTIFQPWLIEFEARGGPGEEAMLVSGGSLIGDSGSIVAPNADGTNPIAPTAFTQVTIAQAASATIENLTRVLTTSKFIALKDA